MTITVHTLSEMVRRMPPDAFQDFAATLDADELALLERAIDQIGQEPWEPYAHQIPPGGAGLDWFLWLLFGGRGAGKTDGAAHYINEHMTGPACIPGVPGGHRAAIIAPTLGDASKSCVNGPSGLKAHNPEVREITRKGGTFVIWPNGAEAMLFGAHSPADVDRLRAGGNTCVAWCEEMAAWRYLRATWNQLRFGLRMGPNPHAIASTTPRRRRHLRRLLKDKHTRVTHAPTSANTKLNPIVRKALYETYANTRLGLQELEGQMLDDVEGALWTDDEIETHRLNPDDPLDAETIKHLKYRRIVVAVDPSWGTSGDEVGIVVVGLGWDQRLYVLDDVSGRMVPDAWGLAAAEAYDKWHADTIVAETNFGAETVRLVMKTVAAKKGRRYPFKEVRASRGKQIRAEPVQALYQQGRVSHVGRFALLEHQMTTWVPSEPVDPDAEEDELVGDPTPIGGESETYDEDETEAALPSEFSPDRIDALVWAITDLALGARAPATARATKGKRRVGKPAGTPGGASSRARPVAGRGAAAASGLARVASRRNGRPA